MINVLILHSEDGQEWAHALIYPEDWTAEKADDLAREVFTAVQKAKPDEWSWEDFEPELEAKGFTIPNWHHGPNWDAVRIDETDEVES